MDNFYQKKIPSIIKDKKIIAAFKKIPRYLFVPELYQNQADEDEPVSIGCDQTTSQPSLIAYMVSLLDPDKSKTILEIGTGSGYQTAILSQLVKKVYSIEIIPRLAKEARERLEKMKIKNGEIIVGDGSEGLEKNSPFEGIIVSAVAPKIPQTLVDQLTEGGRIVIPVSQMGDEKLILGIKKNGKLVTTECMSVHFVPLVGRLGFGG